MNLASNTASVRLPCLSPEGHFIAAQPVEREVRQISQPQKSRRARLTEGLPMRPESLLMLPGVQLQRALGRHGAPAHGRRLTTALS